MRRHLLVVLVQGPSYCSVRKVYWNTSDVQIPRDMEGQRCHVGSKSDLEQGSTASMKGAPLPEKS